MARTITLALLLVCMASAEPVYLSKNGKTFHRVTTCMALMRSKNVLVVDRSAALAHGLKPCSICYRQKSTKAGGVNTTFAQPVKK